MQTPSAPPQIERTSLPSAPWPTGSRSVLVVTPRQLRDGATVLQAVRENTSVVVNSSWLEDASGQRLIDFVCGGLEAMGGAAHRIAEEVFLFTPAQTRVNGTDSGREV
ncbi:MAG: cell division protein SepF [Cyanobium sp. M30B3]|nr:MAG: cell division protein SepF [Cyanobium sp. M30B3]